MGFAVRYIWQRCERALQLNLNWTPPRSVSSNTLQQMRRHNVRRPMLRRKMRLGVRDNALDLL